MPASWKRGRPPTPLPSHAPEPPALPPSVCPLPPPGLYPPFRRSSPRVSLRPFDLTGAPVTRAPERVRTEGPSRSRIARAAPSRSENVPTVRRPRLFPLSGALSDIHFLFLPSGTPHCDCCGRWLLSLPLFGFFLLVPGGGPSPLFAVLFPTVLLVFPLSAPRLLAALSQPPPPTPSSSTPPPPHQTQGTTVC